MIPEGGVFVNVGRGCVVTRRAAPCRAEGRLQIALDVFEQEPLPSDSPLRGIAERHAPAPPRRPTRDRRRDAGALAVKNLRAFAR